MRSHLYFILLVLATANLVSISSDARRRPIYIDDTLGTFIKEDRPFRYISGSFHYWRTPPYYWKDRLLKMASAGLNAVQTYIPWHLHEPYPGEYRFRDELDVIGFLETAKKVGLLVIIRPGPYIDNLNEFGGLPAWLLWTDEKDNAKTSRKRMQLRVADPRFLTAVFSWFDFLFPKLIPHLYPNGGPIFASQVENELGSYQPLSSEKYLSALISRFRLHFGSDLVLFTTDGASGWYLKYLRTPRLVYPTVDFGVQNGRRGVEAAFASQKAALKRLGFGAGPLVNSEYYPGWHDYWGRRFISVDGRRAAETLDDILSLNASVNIFMFVGGTISGFHGGTTLGSSDYYYTATTTWDYDAPVSEAGDPRKKLFLMRDVLRRYGPGPLPPVPPPTNKSDCASSFSLGAPSNDNVETFVPVKHFLRPAGYLPLFVLLPYLCPPHRLFRSRYPLTFEDLRQDYGYVLYRTIVSAALKGNLTARVRDRGLVYVNAKYVGEINRNDEKHVLEIRVNNGDVVEIFVENLGRKDYGIMADDEIFKGLLSNVTLGHDVLEKWTMYSLPLNDTNLLFDPDLWESALRKFKDSGLIIRQRPGFYLFNFTMKYGIDKESQKLCLEGDTFFLMNQFRKGVLFLNGRNIGRYWTHAGPQQTLFIPRPYLNFSSTNDDDKFNVALLFETDGADESPVIPLLTAPILNGPWNPPNVTLS